MKELNSFTTEEAKGILKNKGYDRFITIGIVEDENEFNYEVTIVAKTPELEAKTDKWLNQFRVGVNSLMTLEALSEQAE